MAKNQRQNINIELADGAKDQLEIIRQWNGMTQKELVGRMVNWFCNQDRVSQQVILGQIPDEIAPDVARIMLERIAQADDHPSEPTGGRLSQSNAKSKKQAIKVGEIDV
jgi:hypothetical protein